MVDLDELLTCAEHEAPYLISNLKAKIGKTKAVCDFTVICPVDQKLETLSAELKVVEDLYLSMADKIYRCEKCFREAEVLDSIIEKDKVSIYLSCVEHGRLITREISPAIYDKIKYAWDMKDVKEEKERTY